MANPIEKIIEIIEKTGDNCIVLNQDGSPAYVVLRFGDYDRLISGNSDINGLKGLTEDQLIEKINRDVANWRASQQEADNMANWQSLGEIIKKEVKKVKKEPELDYFSLNRAKSEPKDENYEFEPIE